MVDVAVLSWFVPACQQLSTWTNRTLVKLARKGRRKVSWVEGTSVIWLDTQGKARSSTPIWSKIL